MNSERLTTRISALAEPERNLAVDVDASLQAVLRRLVLDWKLRSPVHLFGPMQQVTTQDLAEHFCAGITGNAATAAAPATIAGQEALNRNQGLDAGGSVKSIISRYKDNVSIPDRGRRQECKGLQRRDFSILL